MIRLDPLPRVFDRYEQAGGVLAFAVFHDATGVQAEDIEGFAALTTTLDRDLLRSLGCRTLTRSQFFGDWYDEASGSLLRMGSYTTSTGAKLENPKLRTLDAVKIICGGGGIPDAGTGGQFAYAFSNPPYNMRCPPSETQTLFDAVCTFIMPPGHACTIRDWASPRLPEVSAEFALGMEWWGVFLFAIHVPELQQLTVIAGSTTD